VAALALPGCGSSDREFTAEEFVQEVSAQGAPMELGQPLSTADADAELYAVEVREEPDAHQGEPEHEEGEAGHEHSGGSLKITDSADAGEEEFRRCEQAVTLLCFRAANAVLIFEQEADPEFLGKLAVAMRGLESG
jgi:hypothetical protein